MGGQVLGGGVIFLVAVALWMLYLLPSWHSRHLYNSSERNAVRLNQALRVLAETSETPEEVRLELNARTALAQQKLARRTQAERGRTELEIARIELEKAKAEARAVRADPAARLARARRTARLVATGMGLLSLAAIGGGAWLWMSAGMTPLVWGGGLGVLVSAIVLNRMARVATRAATRSVIAEPAARTAEVQDVALPVAARPTWEPRTLPRPLSSSAGSAAAAMRDAVEARDGLRRAALEEAKRAQAEKAAPTPIETARPGEAAPAASAFSRMGYVDDAEIEEHVRRMLQQRAAG